MAVILSRLQCVKLGQEAPGTMNGWMDGQNMLLTQVHMYLVLLHYQYRQVSIRRTLVGNKTVDHSDVVGALPVGAAPTTSSFST